MKRRDCHEWSWVGGPRCVVESCRFGRMTSALNLRLVQLLFALLGVPNLTGRQSTSILRYCSNRNMSALFRCTRSSCREYKVLLVVWKGSWDRYCAFIVEEHAYGLLVLAAATLLTLLLYTSQCCLCPD